MATATVQGRSVGEGDTLLIATPNTLRASDGSASDVEARRTLELVTQLRTDFQARDKVYTRIDAALYGRTKIDIPKAYRKVATERRNPLAIYFVNTVAAALSINPYHLQFQAIGKGLAAEANASEREHFFESAWAKQEDQASRRLFRLFMWNLVAKGEGILKTMERGKRAWGDYAVNSKNLLKELGYDGGPPSREYRGMDDDAKDRIYLGKAEEWKKASPYPIFTTDVPPECFYYVKGEDGFTYCCEVKEVPYYETLTRYNQALTGEGKVVPAAMGLAKPPEVWSSIMGGHSRGKGGSLWMVEAWDWKYVTYILQGPGDDKRTGGQIVKRLTHGYGNPFTQTLRGPYFHAQGVTTASRNPDESGLSILYGFLDLFAELDQLLTIQHNAGVFTGFPTFKRNKPAGGELGAAAYGSDGTEDEVVEEIVPGSIYPYDIGPLDMPKSGDALDKSIGLVRQFLDLVLPPSARGSVPNDASGYALNQAAHMARLQWDPIVDNAEIALGARVGFESWLIENRVREDVYVWQEAAPGKASPRGGYRRPKNAGWLGIGPDDLKGVHHYKAKLDPETPANKIIEVRNHEALLKLRLETPDQAIQAIGNNPDEVEEGWLEYELRQDPQIRKKLRDRTFQKLGTIDKQAMTGGSGKLEVSPPVVPTPGVPSGVQAPAVGGVGTPAPPAMAPGPSNLAGNGAIGGGPEGQAYLPGHNMPIHPPAPHLGLRPGGLGNPAGMAPGVQGPPQQHFPLPGEG